jgi:hypothetical protein
MFKSGQLGLRCTVELNCSSLSARLTGASVTRDCALDTCEPNCMPGAVRPFFILVVHNPLWQWSTWQHQSLPQQGGEVRSQGTRDNTGAQLSKEARPETTRQHRSPPQQKGEIRGCRTRGSTGARLDREERSGATGYVTMCMHGLFLVLT